jgi:hypothetical protein
MLSCAHHEDAWAVGGKAPLMLNLSTGRSDWIASGSGLFTHEVRATFSHGTGGCVGFWATFSRGTGDCVGFRSTFSHGTGGCVGFRPRLDGLEKKCVRAVTDWPDTCQLTPDTGRGFSLPLDRVWERVAVKQATLHTDTDFGNIQQFKGE